MQNDYDNRYLALELLKIVYDKRDYKVVNDFKSIMQDLNGIDDIGEILMLRENHKKDMDTINRLNNEISELKKRRYDDKNLQAIITYINNQKINMEPNTCETLLNMINHLV